MRFSAFETISTTAHRDGLPARIVQRAPFFRVLLRLIFLLALFLLLSMPYLALGANLMDKAELWEVIADRPAAFALVLAGFGSGALLLGLPALDCFRRLRGTREIVLTKSLVEVTDRHLLGATVWTCRLSDFVGVAHHVRTCMSGTRDELILVHPRAEQNLLLRVGDAISMEDTQRLAALLGVPVVPAAALYARRKQSRLVPSGLMARVEAEAR